MCTLHQRPDDHARSAALARHLYHGRIADGELRGLAKHRGESLRVPTGRGQVYRQPVLLEQLRVLCNVEVDVTEVMYGLGKLDGLQRRRGSGVSEPESAERGEQHTPKLGHNTGSRARTDC